MATQTCGYLADNAGNRQRGSGIRIERDQDLGRDLDL